MLRRLRLFYVFAAVMVLAALLLEHLNGRFWLNDFRVYYMAAANMRHGLPIYGEVFGEDTGLYKYAPVVLYFFQPYTFLSFHAAGVIHFLIIGALVMACFTVLELSIKHLVGEVPRVSLRASLGLLCIAVLLSRELHMGNINMGLILLAVLGVERFLAGKRTSAGIVWGIVWLIKPYLLLMIVPLVIRREWKVLRTAGITMVVGLLLPMLFEGPVMWWDLLREWGSSMLYHTEVMESPDRLSSLLGQFVGIPPSTVADAVFIALVGSLLAWFSFRNNREETIPAVRNMDFGFELWLALALVPNLVITDQQHFMFSLPLVLFVLAYLFSRRDRTVLVAFLVAMLLYATRSTDLWGKVVENQLVGWGVLGMGNILLIAVAIATWSRWRVVPEESRDRQG